MSADLLRVEVDLLRISERLHDARVSSDGSGVLLPSARLDESMQRLRDDPELAFHMLVDLTAIDRLPQQPRFRVRYDLCQPTRGGSLRVDVEISADEPDLPSVSGVWPAAAWLEREVYDLFGIRFADHPDPRRIVLDENFDGHPLRKDHPAICAVEKRSRS
jgi:NADH-quinone oxidoreductase subunit C